MSCQPRQSVCPTFSSRLNASTSGKASIPLRFLPWISGRQEGAGAGEDPALLLAIGVRRDTDTLPEEPAKRPQTLETDAYVGDGEIGAHQQVLRPLQPPAHQVLMRRLAENLLEAAQEMVGRETGMICYLRDTERLCQIRLHVIARLMRPLIDFHTGGVTHPCQVIDVCMHLTMHEQHLLQHGMELLLQPAVAIESLSHCLTQSL